VKVKVCGLTRPQDAALSCELGAWACGLIFAGHSPRKLALDQAKAVREKIAWPALAVGVFEGNTAEEIARAAEVLRLDMVQLPSGELAKAAGLSSIAVLAPGEAAPAGAAALLVEPKRAKGDRKAGKKPSQAEIEAAWKAAAGLKGLVLVAGGLTPENVARAIEASGCDGVDVASGVESTLGFKDAEKLRAFFAAAGSL